MSFCVIIFGIIPYICRGDGDSRIHKAAQTHGILQDEDSETHSCRFIYRSTFYQTLTSTRKTKMH